MPETIAGNSETGELSDHDLLLMLLASVGKLYELVAEDHGVVMRLDGQLSVFAPLLAKLAPAGGGRMDMIGLMQARREMRRGS